jgi:hypothetical protein
MTRRSLLQRLLLLAGVSSAAPWRAVEAAPPAPPATEPVARALSVEELDDLVAFAEVLVSASFTAAERGYLEDHIRYREGRASGYHLGLYRTTVSLLGTLAGTRFSRLEEGQRAALVARHRLGTPTVWPDEDLRPFPEEMRAVRTRVVADLIGGYYASPAGWAVVGYDAFPGRCGDLARYTVPGQ